MTWRWWAGTSAPVHRSTRSRGRSSGGDVETPSRFRPAVFAALRHRNYRLYWIGALVANTGDWMDQIALNWLLQRPSIATVIIGARNEEQLRQNLAVVDWKLTSDQVAKLDAASAVTPAYPYWHQQGFRERNPAPV